MANSTSSFFPIQRKKAIAIGVKTVDPKHKRDFIEIAKNVITQIDEKMYYASLKYHDKGFIKVGIPFSKKKVKVFVEEDEKEKKEALEMGFYLLGMNSIWELPAESFSTCSLSRFNFSNSSTWLMRPMRVLPLA